MSIVIPDDIVRATKMTEEELKLEIAIMLYKQEKITLGTASQFAGMNQLEFQHILGDRKNPIHYDVEECQPNQTEILQRIEQRRKFFPLPHNLPDTFTLLQEDRAR